jgi:hypothetical protein
MRRIKHESEFPSARREAARLSKPIEWVQKMVETRLNNRRAGGGAVTSTFASVDHLTNAAIELAGSPDKVTDAHVNMVVARNMRPQNDSSF